MHVDCLVLKKLHEHITSARSQDYDMGMVIRTPRRCVAGEEEGGSVSAPPLLLISHLPQVRPQLFYGIIWEFFPQTPDILVVVGVLQT